MTLYDATELRKAQSIGQRTVLLGIRGLLAHRTKDAIVMASAVPPPANALTKQTPLIADPRGIVGCQYIAEQDRLLLVEHLGRFSAIEHFKGKQPRYTVLGTGYRQLEDIVMSNDKQAVYITERVGTLLRVDLQRPNRHQATVISANMVAPHQMVIDEEKQVAYVVEFNNPGRLLKIHLQTGAQNVVLDDLVFPIGLLLTPEYDKAYISEEHINNEARTVICANLEDGQRKELFSSKEGVLFFLKWANDKKDAILGNRREANGGSLWLLDVSGEEVQQHELARVPIFPTGIAATPNSVIVCCDMAILELLPVKRQEEEVAQSNGPERGGGVNRTAERGEEKGE